jgi:hypothetical protein
LQVLNKVIYDFQIRELSFQIRETSYGKRRPTLQVCVASVESRDHPSCDRVLYATANSVKARSRGGLKTAIAPHDKNRA